MKVFISADLEGISGVVCEDDVFPGKDGYPAACKAMTGDVNAAIEGALEAGADEVVVFDAHAGGRNLDLGLLHPEARVIRGQPMPFMIAGLDESFSALFLIGYHARRGTEHAVMDHTYTARFDRVAINGREFGEAGLAAALAGSYGVPVALVAGDDKVGQEIAELLPGVATVATKTGMGRLSAECLSPQKAQEQIREAAKQSLRALGRLKPFALEPPLTLAVDYADPAAVDRAACLPTVERLGARSIACTLEAAPDLIKLLSVLACLR